MNISSNFEVESFFTVSEIFYIQYGIHIFLYSFKVNLTCDLTRISWKSIKTQNLDLVEEL